MSCGIDGTRIFTHFPPADTYNGNFSPEEVEWSVSNFKDGDRSNMSLYLFGWGDGGGGPQAEMIESIESILDWTRRSVLLDATLKSLRTYIEVEGDSANWLFAA